MKYILLTIFFLSCSAPKNVVHPSLPPLPPPVVKSEWDTIYLPPTYPMPDTSYRDSLRYYEVFKPSFVCTCDIKEDTLNGIIYDTIPVEPVMDSVWWSYQVDIDSIVPDGLNRLIYPLEVSK